MTPRLSARCRVVALVVLVTGCSVANALDGGEHVRRAAAEIAVAIGDLSRLLEAGLSSPHRVGLVSRVNSQLGYLDILLREADQQSGRSGASRHQQMRELRVSLQEDDFRRVLDVLVDLQEQYPVRIPGILFDSSSARQFAGLHETLCAACHDRPSTNMERPAMNLSDMAANMGDKEFFARMVVGVKGDVVTGIDNPLSDFQLMGLIAYYKAGIR